MSADLHIHAFPPGFEDAEEHMRCFFSNHLGSRYFAPLGGHRCRTSAASQLECVHWTAVSESDNVWIGEVSWLKAGLLNDDGYIPEPVQAVQDVIGEDLPVLDNDLLQRVLTAAGAPNERAGHYSILHSTSGVAEWLVAHVGCRLFTVSW